MTATHDSILKVHRRGRLCDSAEQRSALVEAYPSSGLSGPRFAALHGVAYQTLAAWVLKLKKSTRSGLPSLSHPAFLPLVAAELEAPSPFGPPWRLSCPAARNSSSPRPAKSRSPPPSSANSPIHGHAKLLGQSESFRRRRALRHARQL